MNVMPPLPLGDGDLWGTHYLAHTTHILVRDALGLGDRASICDSAMPELIDVGWKRGGHFNRRIKGNKFPWEEEAYPGLPQHCLFQDAATRWNSTYLNLERLHAGKWATSNLS